MIFIYHVFWQLIHIMHNLYEAANRDPTIQLTEEEKQFPQKIIETETKCLDKLQDEVSLFMVLRMISCCSELEHFYNFV